MSLMQWLTRSAPTVSWRSIAKAIFNFVPTPSMLLTNTGSRIPAKLGANKPPKPPIRARRYHHGHPRQTAQVILDLRPCAGQKIFKVLRNFVSFSP
jgi:hypothetical protein